MQPVQIRTAHSSSSALHLGGSSSSRTTVSRLEGPPSAARQCLASDSVQSAGQPADTSTSRYAVVSCPGEAGVVFNWSSFERTRCWGALLRKIRDPCTTTPCRSLQEPPKCPCTIGAMDGLFFRPSHSKSTTCYPERPRQIKISV